MIPARLLCGSVYEMISCCSICARYLGIRVRYKECLSLVNRTIVMNKINGILFYNVHPIVFIGITNEVMRSYSINQL